MPSAVPDLRRAERALETLLARTACPARPLSREEKKERNRALENLKEAESRLFGAAAELPDICKRNRRCIRATEQDLSYTEFGDYSINKRPRKNTTMAGTTKTALREWREVLLKQLSPDQENKFLRSPEIQQIFHKEVTKFLVANFDEDVLSSISFGSRSVGVPTFAVNKLITMFRPLIAEHLSDPKKNESLAVKKTPNKKNDSGTRDKRKRDGRAGKSDQKFKKTNSIVKKDKKAPEKPEKDAEKDSDEEDSGDEHHPDTTKATSLEQTGGLFVFYFPKPNLFDVQHLIQNMNEAAVPPKKVVKKQISDNKGKKAARQVKNWTPDSESDDE